MPGGLATSDGVTALADPTLPAAPALFGATVAELVRLHRGRLVGVARSEGLGPDDAFDCAQDAFLLFFSAPEGPSLAGRPDDARRYLVAAARNLARNRRRAHALARPHARGEALDALPDGDDSAEALLAQAVDRGDLLACVHRLDRVQRAVVTLRMLDEHPGESVARELGLTPGHVAVLLHRAKTSLRRCLEGRRGDPDPYP